MSLKYRSSRAQAQYLSGEVSSQAAYPTSGQALSQAVLFKMLRRLGSTASIIHWAIMPASSQACYGKSLLLPTASAHWLLGIHIELIAFGSDQRMFPNVTGWFGGEVHHPEISWKVHVGHAIFKACMTVDGLGIERQERILNAA